LLGAPFIGPKIMIRDEGGGDKGLVARTPKRVVLEGDLEGDLGMRNSFVIQIRIGGKFVWQKQGWNYVAIREVRRGNTEGTEWETQRARRGFG
jgi:hypothetical protein